jgi:hypothetical protein
VPREVDDLKAGQEIALADGAVDMHGSAVPQEAVAEAVQDLDVEWQRLRPPVVAPASALRLLHG